jgi:hypothetical protein
VSRLAIHIRHQRGESQLRVLSNERAPTKDADGTSLPDSDADLSPTVHSTEIIAFSLFALLLISIVATLYVAKGFFLPVVAAFVVGTMLSPAAGLFFLSVTGFRARFRRS